LSNGDDKSLILFKFWSDKIGIENFEYDSFIVWMICGATIKLMIIWVIQPGASIINQPKRDDISIVHVDFFNLPYGAEIINNNGNDEIRRRI